MNKIVITGGQGFLGTYLCLELLNHGYQIVSVDNYSKYGKIDRPQDKHPNFKFYQCDIVHDFSTFSWILNHEQPDIIISAAALIGGCGYFNKYPATLLSTNEKILANTFDKATELYQRKILKQIIMISSSMVFERTDRFPTKESDLSDCKLPITSYGFQKLSCEYFCHAFNKEFNLPFNIVRPYNLVGSFEEDDETIGMTHVLPDLIKKTLSGQNPLEILGSGQQTRCYTNGKDVARAIRLLIESNIQNENFNISIDQPTTVLELAEKVWNKLRDDKFEYKLIDGFGGDIEYRWPDVTKSEQLLNFKAEISLDQSIDETIQYIKGKLNV